MRDEYVLWPPSNEMFDCLVLPSTELRLALPCIEIYLMGGAVSRTVRSCSYGLRFPYRLLFLVNNSDNSDNLFSHLRTVKRVYVQVTVVM